MSIHIITIGKLEQKFSQIAQHYYQMIKWPLRTTAITYNHKTPPTQIKDFEATLISKHSKANSVKIALTEAGEELNSHQFASLISSHLVHARKLDFIIGGAFGLSPAILHNAYQLSLSRMTMPHQMAKLILLEQIYRAQTILTGHPYHK